MVLPRPTRELHLFAGAGGGLLGSTLLGHVPVCAVEQEGYERSVLLARQRDGVLPKFPIWDDVRTFDGKPWKGRAELVSGGFPCKQVSSAGTREGLAGPDSGLWFEFARIIGEVEPAKVFIENSQHLRTRGLVRVLQDLAELGYDAAWCVLGASEVGAPHKRKRLWVVAHRHNKGQRTQPIDAEMARAPATAGPGRAPDHSTCWVHSTHWWPVDFFKGVDDGISHRMDRVRATGNGQVPLVAAVAYRHLDQYLSGRH